MKTTTTQKRYWLSELPETCDLCGTNIRKVFIDGKTDQGPWAIMCPSCHCFHGHGHGVGRGQQYMKQSDGKWLKTEG